MNLNDENDRLDRSTSLWRKKRYFVVLMAFLGFVNLYTMRVNLSVAIVAMTEDVVTSYPNGTEVHDQQFHWNSKERGLVLGSFFYGYILTQFIGGYIASTVGGSLVFGLGITATAILTLLTPLAAKQGVYYLVAIRVVEGCFGGLSFPSINTVYAKWAPPLERSRMSGYGISGCFAGTVIAMLASGSLAVHFGWESIFYCFGIVGLIWCLAWALVIKESPENDRFISDFERNFIMNSLIKKGTSNVLKPPWKSMFTSKPIIAIAVAHFSYTWGYYTLLTQLPTYLRDMLHFEIEKTGFIAAIPYLVLSILLFVSGFLADWFQVNQFLSTSQVRKYFNNLSFLAQMIFLLLAGYFANPTAVLVCLTLSVGLGAFSISGYMANPLDIAPQFSSIILGMSNTFATVPGLISPILTGYIVTTPSEEEWKKVFYLAAGIYLVGIFVYGIFASGKLQPWAVIVDDEHKLTLNKLTVDDKNNVTTNK